MIVRVLGEGQWRVDDDLHERLNELDEQVAAAVEAGDEAALRTGLAALAEVARTGEPLAADDLSASDVIVPPEDLSLAEARELLTGEGFIPDLPVPEKA